MRGARCVSVVSAGLGISLIKKEYTSEGHVPIVKIKKRARNDQVKVPYDFYQQINVTSIRDYRYPEPADRIYTKE